ncbi:hypothetical protein B0T25DRAFT_69922 [Lasiosphaeria hispida]|uniref:G domain-containing protein n=1 Tax=Lasiosphaeria hispida TaxID=260671 RepID=A0AAJ0HXC5_9PEZI|nr:hypothetical protein B0T25DRAFT_69922 [Lasiosphaeria hispida]
MGVTGSGKSTFVSLLADQDVDVSHGLQSHTIRGRPYSFQDPESGENVILIDMPGFDDTSRSDAEILRELSYCLAILHLRNIRLAGLVYLHRVSDPRMTGSAIKNLCLFQSLCGQQNYGHVVLATTMWAEIEEERVIGLQRERELRNTYWADMIQRGSKVKEHNGSRKSALDIVRTLTGTGRPVTLAIQYELIVEGRTLGDTEVGRILSQEIDADMKKAVRNTMDLNSGLEEAERDDDHSAAASIRAEREEAEAQAAKRARDKEGLGVRFQQLAEQERQLYAAIVREEKQKRKVQRVPASRARASPSRDSNTDTAAETNKPRKPGLLRRKGIVYGAQGRKNSLIIPERTSSLGKTIPERLLLLFAT